MANQAGHVKRIVTGSLYRTDCRRLKEVGRNRPVWSEVGKKRNYEKKKKKKKKKKINDNHNHE